MADEDKQLSINFFRFVTAMLTLVFIFGTSVSLMNFSNWFVHWNGVLGQIVDFWDLNITQPSEVLLGPLAKWIGWRSNWIANYIVFGFFFYTLILCASKLLSDWDKSHWVSLALSYPLGVLAWPGLITLLVKSSSEDFGSIRNLVSLVITPFLILIVLLIVNFWV